MFIEEDEVYIHIYEIELNTTVNSLMFEICNQGWAIGGPWAAPVL
jgi:hypothetical protein